MKHTTRPLLLAAALLVFAAASPLHAEELRLSAAASMSDVFKELIRTFTSQHPEVTIVSNFGPSGGLAKQITQGAPADLYVSANPKWMNYLLDQKLIAPGRQTTFAYNSLVFVGRKETKASALADLPQLERIGLGSPRSVPAGQYAEEALRASGLYEQLAKDGKLVMAKDVRQALIYADRGETSGSFVYKTDALLAADAVILFEVPQELYSRVSYPLGLTTDGADKQGARDFYDFISSAAGSAIVLKYGFSVPE